MKTGRFYENALFTKDTSDDVIIENLSRKINLHRYLNGGGDGDAEGVRPLRRACSSLRSLSPLWDRYM